MKAYIIVLTLLICSYGKAQDTGLFNRVDSFVAKINLAAAQGMFDTLKTTMQNGYPPGTTSTIFLLTKGQEVQKMTYLSHNTTNVSEFVIFKDGKPALRNVFTSSAPWKYYFVGETAYLYIKEDSTLVTLGSKFHSDQIDRHLRLFKE